MPLISHYAVTTCELPQPIDGQPPTEFQIVPIGAWFDIGNDQPIALTADLVKRLFDRAVTMSTDLFLDWRHRSIADPNKSADPAADERAACWIPRDGLQLRPDGIWATRARWTMAGATDVAGGAYRYISPVVFWDFPHPVTGERGPHLFNAALTNTPNLDGIKPLLKLVAATVVGHNTKGTPEMKTLIAWLRERGQNVDDAADETQIVAALSQLETALAGRVPEIVRAALNPTAAAMTAPEAVAQIDQLRASVPTDVAVALGHDKTVTAADAVVSIMSMKSDSTHLTANAATVAETVREQLADQQLLRDAQADGRIAPAMASQFSTLLTSSDPAVRANVRKMVADMPKTGPAAPPLGLGEKKKAPVKVSKYDIAVAEQMGLTPEQVAGVETEAADV